MEKHMNHEMETGEGGGGVRCYKDIDIEPCGDRATENQMCAGFGLRDQNGESNGKEFGQLDGSLGSLCRDVQGNVGFGV